MKHIDRRMGIILGALVFLGYVYYRIDCVYLEASPSTVGGLLAAVGSWVPKAIWRSAYFDAHDQPVLGAQLLRVHGFCTLLFLAVNVCYGVYRTWAPSESGLDLLGQRLKQEALEKVKRWERLIWLGIALFVWMNFIGPPLDDNPRLPFEESTSGEFVIAFPIIGMPLLFCVIYYAIRVRSFLRAYR